MKLLAIDGNSILNRAFYGVKLLSNKNGVYTNAIYGFLSIYIKLIKDNKPDGVVAAFDVSGKTFRHEKYQEYKANRKGMPEELYMQLPIMKEILSHMGVKILQQQGYEGDDIVGTVARMSCESQNECIVASGDRDNLQLINDCVSVSLAKNSGSVLYTPQVFFDEYGISASQLIDLKALMGDSSDNIPGVRGIGEKTALTLIKNYSSIENIYENIEEIQTTPRIRGLLKENKENAFLSKELATIDVFMPLDFNIEECIAAQPDNDALAKKFIELEMFSFLQKFGLDVKNNDRSQICQTKPVDTIIIKNPEFSTVTEKLKNLGKIYFLYNQSLLINVENTIYVFDKDPLDALINIVIKSNYPKYTFLGKNIYKIANDNELTLQNLVFDVQLAAYLLSPSSREYSLPDLSQKFLFDTSFNVSEEYYDIAALPSLCERLLQKLESEDMLTLFQTIEMPLCEVLSDMEYEGFGIDTKGLSEFGKELKQNIEELKLTLFSLAGEEFNPNSTKELSAILFEKLGLPCKKKTKTGYSTNIDVLESLMDSHEIVPVLMEYRKLTKLYSTYVIGLLKVVTKDGRVHSTFNQTETRTGRISSTEPNVQNIPVRSKLGGEIRKFFVARDGYTLVDADYSQIELRILAHIAKDENMIEAFKNGVDIHTATAAQVFKFEINDVPAEYRSRAKAINFGIVYGIGAYSLSKDINVSVYEAKEYIKEYFATYSGVESYMKGIIEKAKADGFVTTLYGRRRELADINSTNKTVQAFASRVALNTPIQGTAADIIKIAMVKVFTRLKKENLDARLILQVHDELIVEAPFMQAETIKKLLKEEMESAAQLAVKLVTDVNTGANWFLAKG
ncbi:MAG: DNA polymerase I [Oscillospiraceae bacterium]